MEILTGNELASGATVYLDASGRWVEDLQAARLFAEGEAAARDEALARTSMDLGHGDGRGRWVRMVYLR